MNGGFNYEIVEHNGERFIRAGMRTIDGVGPGTAQKIEGMRAGCPYADTQDLIQRVPKRSLNTARLDAMVKAGATIDLEANWADYERRSIHYCSQLSKGGR
jgi:DNA polymerase III alpha subunit